MRRGGGCAGLTVFARAQITDRARVGFVNSIARICRQIQRSGGGARPPGSGRAIVARRLSRQFALPSDADAKRARDIWDLAIPFLRRTARRGEGLHLQPEALSLFRPRWSDRSARDGRLFAARERDIASKVAALIALQADMQREFAAIDRPAAQRSARNEMRYVRRVVSTLRPPHEQHGDPSDD